MILSSSIINEGPTARMDLAEFRSSQWIKLMYCFLFYHLSGYCVGVFRMTLSLLTLYSFVIRE